jgi:replicative DNA helicase
MSGALVAERTLPHNLEAERSVLGACLMNPDAFGEAVDILRPEDFFRDAHRRLFEAMKGLADRGIELDLVTVKNALLVRGQLDEIGGPVYLAALTDGVPRSSNVAHYARIVREKADLRALIHTATKLEHAAYEADSDSADVLRLAERELFDLSQQATRRGWTSMKDLMPRLLDKIETATKAQSGVTGLSTGLRDLDEMTRGMQPGNIILIAARPSQGKSALALNMAIAAAQQGQTVGIFSLEMSDEEWGIRALAGEARVNGHRVQSGMLGQKDWGKLAQAMGTLAELPVYIDDSADLTPLALRTKAKRLQAEHGLGLVVVDYAQLMSGEGRSETREREIAQVSRTLKRIAKEFKIPVIELSQLSRKVEERSDTRPQLSDLRESGALEQDADLVIFIHREEQYRPDDPTVAGVADLIIAKQRNGPTGTVKTSFIREYSRFENYEPGSAAPDGRLPVGDR